LPRCSLPLLPLMSFSMMFLLSSFLRFPRTPLRCRPGTLRASLPTTLTGALSAAFADACALAGALARASHAQHLQHTCPSP
jgi:hypothetical protein